MRSALLLLLVFLATNLVAQQFSLSGNVKDANGQPIPGAGIYISGSKTATVTDSEGNFSFKTLAPGSYDVLVQMIGFTPKKVSADFGTRNEFLKIILLESTTNIKEVVILPDAQRANFMRIFREQFIGITRNADNCVLKNPEVVRIDFDKANNVLNVTATDFLIIENAALGYKIKYLLENFSSDFKTRIVYYEGYPTFEEMDGGNAKKRRWQAARQVAYYGSTMHFYRSLFNGTSTADGYIINKMAYQPNLTRQPDAVINANIKRLSAGQQGLNRVLTINGTDSLSYWMRMRNEPKTLAILNRAIVNPDTLVHTYTNDIKYLHFTDELYIQYTKEKEEPGIMYSGFRLSRPMDIGDIQISQIKPLQPAIGFYKSGTNSDPTSSLSSGYFAYEKMAEQLPIEYEPPAKKK